MNALSISSCVGTQSLAGMEPKTPTPPPSEPRHPAAYLALRRGTRRRTTSCRSGRREVHQQCSCGRCNASLSVLKLGPAKEVPLLDPAPCGVHRGSVKRRVRVHKFGDGWCPLRWSSTLGRCVPRTHASRGLYSLASCVAYQWSSRSEQLARS